MSGTDTGPSARWNEAARWSTLTAIVLGAGAAIAWNLARPHVVQASVVGGSTDADGDGLPDVLEQEIGSDRYLVDSDFDGVSDAEEYARHSSLTKAWEVPGSAPAGVGMGIYAKGSQLRFITAIYLSDGSLDGKSLKLGLIKSSVPVMMPKVALGTGANLTIVPASVPGELVAVYEAPITASILRGNGSASIYSVLTGPGGIAVADAVNVARIDGALCQRFTLTTQPGGSPGTTLQVASGSGGVFKPIAGSGAPSSWTPGEICNQSTKLVGYSGGAAVQEVTAASCESGWDAYCDPACAASVGTTITIIDPAVLVGG